MGGKGQEMAYMGENGNVCEAKGMAVGPELEKEWGRTHAR